MLQDLRGLGRCDWRHATCEAAIPELMMNTDAKLAPNATFLFALATLAVTIAVTYLIPHVTKPITPRAMAAVYFRAVRRWCDARDVPDPGQRGGRRRLVRAGRP